MQRPRFSVLVLLSLTAAPVRAQLPEVVDVSPQDVLAEVRLGEGEITVVNFWATWCDPCEDEMRVLVRIGREFGSQGLRLLFVSADYPESRPEVQHYLAEQGVKARSFMSSGDNQAFFNAVGARWSGALPATALFGPSGTLLDFWEGTKTYEQVAGRMQSALSPAESSDNRR